MSHLLPHQPAGRLQHVWHSVEEKDGTSEPLPTEVNTVDHPRFLTVSKDRLTVRYVGRGNHSQDVGAARTNWPCPHQCFVYYFEVTIIDSGSRGSIAVGLADGEFELNRQPGWEPNSYGYHGHDGQRYFDSERGEQYGQSFGAGDTIGCGLLTDRREIFFTRNGSLVGVAFSDIKSTLYPTVGLHSPGEKVAFNLGATSFVFDIDAFAHSQREARLSQIVDTPLPEVDLESLVKAYLLHNNYGLTLAKMEAGCSGSASSAPGGSAASAASGATSAASASHGAAAGPCAHCAPEAAAALDIVERALPPPSHAPGADPPRAAKSALGDAGCKAAGDRNTSGGASEGAASPAESALRSSLTHRRELRLRLLQGDVPGALELTEGTFPGLLERHPYLHFRLKCQHFIELLRNEEPMAAVGYAQTELARYQPPKGQPPTPEAASELEEVFSLVAYEMPEAGGDLSPSHLMSVAQREATADLLNSAVLLELGAPPCSTLERLLQQLLEVHEASRKSNLGYGPNVKLVPRAAGASGGGGGGGGDRGGGGRGGGGGGGANGGLLQ